jgi:hypothetical protein
MGFQPLIIEPPGQRLGHADAAGRKAYACMQRVGESLPAHGKLKAVELLAWHAHAVRVHTAGGRPQVRHGPFAEAKKCWAASPLSSAPTWTRRSPSSAISGRPGGRARHCEGAIARCFGDGRAEPRDFA